MGGAFGFVAQWIEQRCPTPRVAGSSPARPTITHSNRQRKGGNLVAKKSYVRDPRNRILENILEVQGCWVWTKTVNDQGYGLMTVEGKRWRCSRFSYTVFIGEIPKGQVIRHTCDNPPCCNPEHLIPGTHSDNTKDMVRRGRHGLQKLDETSADYIRENPEGLPVRDLMDRFEVSEATIYDIRKGRTWT